MSEKKNDAVFNQNQEEKAEFKNIFFMKLLFREKPACPDKDSVYQALTERFGQVDTVTSSGLISHAVKKYPVAYQDATIPAQVVMGEPQEFDPGEVDTFIRSQFWDTANADELLDSCHYQILIFDMMSAGLPYEERCDLLMDWLETALSLYPDCAAVYMEASGKFFAADQVRNHQIPREDRFIYFCVNVRFFNIQGSNDFIVDTLGLYAIDLPDVQYHFHDLDPNQVVNHAYNVASYIYANHAPIKNGETVDGLVNGVLSQRAQWKCQYEDALIQPVRCVMDICAGKYASGQRN